MLRLVVAVRGSVLTTSLSLVRKKSEIWVLKQDQADKKGYSNKNSKHNVVHWFLSQKLFKDHIRTTVSRQRATVVTGRQKVDEQNYSVLILTYLLLNLVQHWAGLQLATWRPRTIEQPTITDMGGASAEKTPNPTKEWKFKLFLELWSP